ncbi:MAG: bifunctional enoyl-CoA hydratase/phosphate acetyltransferase [Moraxellaceae bacterium]|nr:bifunctional enoyl-CoA hydratase/phosphate acetyltransferase [Moraxellaceae bacterium]
MSVRELTAPSSTVALYSRALLGAFAGKNGKELPDVELVMRDVKIDRDALAAYNRVCGFSQKETLPATYGFVLAFPLQMELMTSPDFPFAAMGMVHIRNSITQHRPVSASETLTVAVRPANLRPHDKGLQFDFLTTLTSRGEVVWESVSTMLRRGGGSAAGESKAAPQKPSAPVSAAVVQWTIPGDTGRRYGAVSGDRNPIHLYAFTAKLFGFPRAIAHGMWTKARCLAALESRLPDAFTVDVQFKLPVLLPAKVAFHSDDMQGGGIAFGVSDSRSGKPHLAGTIVGKR